MNSRKTNIDYCELPTAQLAYNIFGSEGTANIVIEGQLASCSSEWWHIAEKLSEKFRVLTYDRAGYGKSSLSKLPRTPENIAVELNQLLERLSFDKNLILIGHSQGGLYVQQYIRLFGDTVIGALVLDPLSADDKRFKESLSGKEYAGAYIDKSKNLKMAYQLSRFKITPMLRSKFLLSPPFFYFEDFTEEATDYMLDSFISAKHYKTALDEYNMAHEERFISALRSGMDFPNIPLHVIYHTADVMVEEMIKFGGLTREEAVKVEKLWEDIIRGYLELSEKSKFILSKKSPHGGIHLIEPELIYAAIDEIIEG